MLLRKDAGIGEKGKVAQRGCRDYFEKGVIFPSFAINTNTTERMEHALMICTASYTAALLRLPIFDRRSHRTILPRNVPLF
jgi:hypothetical protein